MQMHLECAFHLQLQRWKLHSDSQRQTCKSHVNWNWNRNRRKTSTNTRFVDRNQPRQQQYGGDLSECVWMQHTQRHTLTCTWFILTLRGNDSWKLCTLDSQPCSHIGGHSWPQQRSSCSLDPFHSIKPHWSCSWVSYRYKIVNLRDGACLLQFLREDSGLQLLN